MVEEEEKSGKKTKVVGITTAANTTSLIPNFSISLLPNVFPQFHNNAVGKIFYFRNYLLPNFFLPQKQRFQRLFLPHISCTVPSHQKSNDVNVCLMEYIKINLFKKFRYQIKHS